MIPRLPNSRIRRPLERCCNADGSMISRVLDVGFTEAMARTMRCIEFMRLFSHILALVGRYSVRKDDEPSSIFLRLLWSYID